MQTTLYSATIPGFIGKLKGLKAVLAKGQAHATEKHKDQSEYLEAKLAPDMFPLVKQVQIACDAARLMPYRLTDTEAPSVDDTEKSFGELYTRIDDTIAELEKVAPETINKAEDAIVRNKYIPGKHFTGLGYAMSFTTANFYFHITTAYGILRHLGVDVGKTDFMGELPLADDVA